MTIKSTERVDGLTLMKSRIEEIRTLEMFEQYLKTDLLPKWLQHIGYTQSQIVSVIDQIRAAFVSDRSILEVEEELHDYFWSTAPDMERRLREEEALVAREVDPYLSPGSVLDVGCGSGRIAKILSHPDRPVHLVDVVGGMNATDLPFVLYDGKSLPFADGSFTSAMSLTVLHHCDDPELVLAESVRVINDRLVAIESVYVNDSERRSNMFFDWLWNRVVYYGKNINVPFNFDHPANWAKRFEHHGLRVVHSEDLDYDSPMTPEHHWLYVLEK